MCGIAGVLHFDGERASQALVRKMTDAQAHRGPDGSGVYTDDCVGLGHRRLAIIDLSDAGRQPMHSPDGRFVITYNGELYNYRELRTELRALGHEFVSQSDTEVVLAAYAQWGDDALPRFNGMFAFAIWDRKRKRLFLARDRYGIKPLYYAFFANRLLFASEQKGILASPDVPRRLDAEGLREYFTFQNFFTDRTLLRGLHLFPPGSWAVVEAGHPCGDLRPTRYWDPQFAEPERSGDPREYVEELRRLFVQAVRRQLVSDVEIGAFLSGGMDSGSIAAVAARELPYIKTFTCGFDLHSASGMELGFDEREAAEHMSYLFKTEHYEMVLKAGDMERILPTVAWHLEEPRVGQSYPNYYTSRLAGKFNKVVLAGTGGDEFFGGYPWRYYRAAACIGFEEFIDRYYAFWQRLIPDTDDARIFKPLWNEVRHVDTREIFRGIFDTPAAPCTPEDYVNHSLYLEVKTFLHGLLVVEDKLAMANGVEIRVPFLDNDLVDFAMRVPVNLKIANLSEVVRLNENLHGDKVRQYYSTTRDGKLILREAMSNLVPETVTSAVKQGFSAPDASWFKGDSIRYVRKLLFSDKPRLFDYLDRNTVQELVMQHLEGKVNRRLFIWSLLNFEWWIRKYLDGAQDM